MLGEFYIKYMPCTTIKGQVLANLVVEFTKYPTINGAKEQAFGGEQVSTVSIHGHPSWTLYVDGAANQKESRVGIVIISPDRITIEKSLRLGFLATNNEAKYEALLVGIVMIKKLGGKAAEVFSDS